MASLLGVSSPNLSYAFSRQFSFSASVLRPIQFKGFTRSLLLVPTNCLSSESGEDGQPESAASSSSPPPRPVSASNSLYLWCAGLGGVGFVETAYLTYLKLANTDAFCPIGGGTCSDVLNSDYALVFGVPLPLIGMVAYGLVAALGLQLDRNNLPFGISETYGRLILLGSTTSMAAASAYFLYVLSTELSGASCFYCLISVLLSFSLFFITLKDYGLQEVQKKAGLQLCIASLVIVALRTSYSTAQPVSSSILAELNLPFVTTEITTPSNPFALSLAKHLHSIGAKMYGAFWCSHCLEQKQMFGREAVEQLDYVECFPNGYKTGLKMEKACLDAGIEGFPTWLINGQVVSGEIELTQLAELSGFKESAN